MKVNDTIANIATIKHIHELNNKRSVQSGEQAQKPVSPAKLPSKTVQPVDLLSNDELSMLHKLFPGQKNDDIQSDGYSINRIRSQLPKLGNFIDVKR